MKKYIEWSAFCSNCFMIFVLGFRKNLILIAGQQKRFTKASKAIIYKITKRAMGEIPPKH